jgi:branched-chain amino acid transport system ATP-binding protein
MNQPQSASAALLDVQSVSIAFGGLKAVQDFSLSLPAGALYGLIGPNGAGKTTVFNLLTGVYVPSTGSIRVDGHRINGKKPFKIVHAGLARTFQNIRLFGELSVLDNVKLGAQMRREHGIWGTLLRSNGMVFGERSADVRSRELLHVFGLSSRMHEQARNLPYGDQRRLEIARALATGPKVLLLDEPAAGMNPQEKIELMELIRFVRDRFSLAVLLIEHDMKLVMNICEKITVLDHGEIIAVGTPEEIRCDRRVVEAYLGESEDPPDQAGSEGTPEGPDVPRERSGPSGVPSDPA